MGSRAATTRSFFLSWRTHENMPSRYFGASTSCSMYFIPSAIGYWTQSLSHQRYDDLTIRMRLVMEINLTLLSQDSVIVNLSIDSKRQIFIFANNWLRSGIYSIFS